MSVYTELLKDPRWQKKRLEILERDKWTCQMCFDDTSTLTVHHRTYLDKTNPWDYPDVLLVTLCISCHKEETANRQQAENVLIDSLRRSFYARDLYDFASGFYKIKLQHIPDIVASAYSFALESHKIQRYILKQYWNYQIKKIRNNNPKVGINA